MPRHPRGLIFIIGTLLWPSSNVGTLAQTLSVPPSLIPSCPSPAYSPIAPPDRIADAWNTRKRYRLVIGVGEFDKDPGMNRSYVDPTAALVDNSLASLGYKPLPGLKDSAYLSGQNATKTNIMAALSWSARSFVPSEELV